MLFSLTRRDSSLLLSLCSLTLERSRDDDKMVLGRAWALLLAAAAVFGTTDAQTSENNNPDSQLVSPPKDEGPEPTWGRLYVRRGLAPIQYFRDSYGGPMPNKELEFLIPSRENNRFGCTTDLPETDLEAIRATNGSAALIVNRGVCSFEIKSRAAEALGVAALVVVSTDDNVRRPAASPEDDSEPINIPTVMIRCTAGDMILATLDSPRNQRVFGRLMPMRCEKSPYVCTPRTAAETMYMGSSIARSGLIVTADEKNVTLGSFLSSTYGGVLPHSANALRIFSIPLKHGCDIPDKVAGMVAVVEYGGSCSVLQKIMNAQQAGAFMVLVAMPTMGKHPTVGQDWLGYNVSIASAAISQKTAKTLLNPESSRDGVRFLITNRIAENWDVIRKLSDSSAWPNSKDNRERMVKRLVASFTLDETQTTALKRHFVSVAGGSGADWDELVSKPRESAKSDKRVADSVVVPAKSAPHDDL